MNNEPPKDIDQIIAKFLDFADHAAENKSSDANAVCQLGWLVLGIKKSQAEAAAKNKPLAAVVTDATLEQIEREGKLE